MPDRLPVVILAGGTSRRFEGDKLLAPLHRRAVLAQVVDRVSPIATDVLVATSSASRGAELAAHLPPSTRFLYDRPARWGNGPAATIASACEQLGEQPVLFVPGDVPWIETRALRRFVFTAGRVESDVAVPFWQSGETEHLFQWQRGRDILSHLPWEPGFSAPTPWRASEFLRAVPRTLLVPILSLTSVPGSFSHVTYPPDLHHPVLRGLTGRGRVNRSVEGAPKRAYRSAQAARKVGDLSRATAAFGAESRWYARAGLKILARHAKDDAEQASGEALIEIPAGARLRTPAPVGISEPMRIGPVR